MSHRTRTTWLVHERRRQGRDYTNIETALELAIQSNDAVAEDGKSLREQRPGDLFHGIRHYKQYYKRQLQVILPSAY